MKKPVLFFTTADDNNLPYAKACQNSFKKFHPDIPFHIVQGEELQAYLKDDPHFFYRQKPILGEKYLKEYDLVVGIDADSIVLGDLSYIWTTTDYDIGTVLNYNRKDAEEYGPVAGWGIIPPEYFNCGLVAMRNPALVHTWLVNCFTPQWERLQYKEQDVLNGVCYFGNWNVRCFDHGDGPAKLNAWWGLIGKADWNRAEMRGDDVVVPKGEGTPPLVDTVVKVIHMGGGSGAKKDNWGIYFQDDVLDRINMLKSDTPAPTKDG